MSEVKVNKISPRSSTTVTLGDASDLFQLPASAEIDIASGATLDVNGTIDVTGATTTGFPTGGLLGVVVYTADGTYTPGNTTNGTAGDEGNADVTKIIVEVQGAGGGGGGSHSAGYGAGAGGGGYSRAFRSLTNITTCTVTVGDGGTVSNNASGGDGGLSKIEKGTGDGTFADVIGNGGALGTYNNGDGGLGGTATGGFLNIQGGYGCHPYSNLMGSGGGTQFSPVSQDRSRVAHNPPDPPTGYGGGGIGSRNTSAGAGASGSEGADGIIIIYEYA